jgi:16S rRNA G966 N2-methylase RsmD
VFVDDHRQACGTITQNLAKTRLDGGRAVLSEVFAYLKRDGTQYDLIFADPPYWHHHGDKDRIGDLLKNECLVPRLAPGAWFIAEISAHQSSPVGPGVTLADRREYGGSAVLFYQLAPAVG